MKEDKYATYYEVHYSVPMDGMVITAEQTQKFFKEDNARDFAAELRKDPIHYPIWITQTDPIDIWESDDD